VNCGCKFARSHKFSLGHIAFQSLAPSARKASAMAASTLAQSAFCGTSLPSLAPAKAQRTQKSLQVMASGGKKTITKTPLGPSGDFKSKVDASGRSSKGYGTYRFTKKYGANVDGYSPIYTPDQWSPRGRVYEGGATGLALWAVTFGALLAVGAFLVYSTSNLA